jgi:c-di-GMP-binding flagellar brake protein YcgR
MESRRRVPRVSAIGLSARYMVEGSSASSWRECRVIDISILGVGLKLFGPLSDDLLGKKLVVEVQAPVAESVTISLRGQVRNLNRSPEGEARVGVDFVGLSETELAVLKVMELMKVVW